jgi:hypothetical protein
LSTILVPNYFLELLEVTEAAFPRTVPWKKGGSGEKLTTESQQVVDLFVPAWIYILMKDEDRGTVGAAAQAIGKACKIFGPGAIEAHVIGAVTCLVNVLK